MLFLMICFSLFMIVVVISMIAAYINLAFWALLLIWEALRWAFRKARAPKTATTPRARVEPRLTRKGL